MKTNQSPSTTVDDSREISFPKMQKVLTKLQEVLKNVELESGTGSIETAKIRYRGKSTNRKAVLSFEGSGFNMTINLTQPVARKGAWS